MDAPSLWRTAPSAYTARPPRDARHRAGHARAGDDLAGTLLPFRLGLGPLRRGVDQRLVRPPFAPGPPPARGLEARGSAGFGRPYLRLFLGAVELLLLPEMDLRDAGRRLLVRLRDAAFGLPRLPAIRAGALRAGAPIHGAPAASAAVAPKRGGLREGGAKSRRSSASRRRRVLLGVRWPPGSPGTSPRERPSRVASAGGAIGRARASPRRPWPSARR